MTLEPLQSTDDDDEMSLNTARNQCLNVVVVVVF